MMFVQLVACAKVLFIACLRWNSAAMSIFIRLCQQIGKHHTVFSVHFEHEFIAYCVYRAAVVPPSGCTAPQDTPRPLTSKLKLLPEKNTRSITLVGLAEQSAAYPVKAKTALRL